MDACLNCAQALLAAKNEMPERATVLAMFLIFMIFVVFLFGFAFYYFHSLRCLNVGYNFAVGTYFV